MRVYLIIDHGDPMEIEIMLVLRKGYQNRDSIG